MKGINMKNKEQFLTLEDSTVNVLNGLDMEKLHNIIPDTWIQILSLENAESRCKAVIELWKKYLEDKLPSVIARFDEGLENIELLERLKKGEKKYSLLYSIIYEEGKCI